MNLYNTENLILFGAILLFLSIVASKTSGRLGVPSLIIFMAIGMLAGVDGIGKISFSDFNGIQKLGTVALVFILFSGGLDTKAESVRPVMWHGISLSTLGVLFTAGTTGILVWQFTNFSLVEGLLLGSIISSTDAAAVFSILRSKNIGLRGRLRPILELESGSNDPMAYFLTIAFIQLANYQGMGIDEIGLMFLIQMSVGTAYGFLLGKIAVWVVNRIRLDYDGLYPVLIIAIILFTYSISAYSYGNGFLSVYIAALVMGNSSFIHKKSMTRFFDGQAWLMQIIMFIFLGLLVNPREMIPIMGTGLLVSVILMFLARPIGVFISLIFFKLRIKEKIYISWVGLRGAVPIIFATFPVIAGVENAMTIFNVVFFVVLTSVALQGTTLLTVAKWLKLQKHESAARRYPLEMEFGDTFNNEMLEISIPPGNPNVNKRIVEIGFPKNSLIVLIERDKKYITPNGNTVLMANDNLLIMTNSSRDVNSVYSSLNVNREQSTS